MTTHIAQRLLILFTGGTIGSRKQNTAINVDEAGTYALVDAYRASSFNRTEVELTTTQPLNLLSENLLPQDWLTLARAVQQIDQSAYDGIIITHGSDTLAYSSVLLGYLFAAASIPIIVTASNYPLEDSRSNGLRNFANSINFVMDAGLPGVYAVYENDEGRPLVYLATRITQAVSFTDQFGSPYDCVLGEMKASRFVSLSSPLNPNEVGLRQSPSFSLNWQPDTLKLEDRILYIKPYPGLNYTLYTFTDNQPRAILHDLHHSGTACAVTEGPYSLPAFIQACRERNIPVYICPIKDSTEAMYASTRGLLDAGAIVLEGITMEAALVKLMLAYGLHEDNEQAERVMTGQALYYERLDVYNKR